MGQYVTYVCDYCKKEWRAEDKDNQIVCIELRLAFGNTSVSDLNYPKISQSWCRKCISKFGLTPQEEEQKPIIYTDIAEQLADIIEAMGFKRGDK